MDAAVTADPGAPAALRAKALLGSGRLALLQCDYAPAVRRLEAALRLYRELADAPGIASTLQVLGSVAREQGRYARSMELHRESLAIAESAGDRWAVANAHNTRTRPGCRCGTRAWPSGFRPPPRRLGRRLVCCGSGRWVRPRSAAAAYGGDFLAGLAAGEWAAARRDELRRSFESALLATGRLHAAAGRHQAAATAFRRAVAHEPLNETAHRELMESWASLGETARAVRHYEELTRQLAGQLGVPPSAETTALYQRLLGQP